MKLLHSEILQIRSGEDVVRSRQAVRAKARELGFGAVSQTKLMTAASELARNALEHGGGGTMCLEVVDGSQRQGLRLTFEDAGPGIADIPQAMIPGYTSRGGMGMGLGGAKKLVDEFHIESQPGHGTKVAITRWR
ncbi:MAG: anti-sigma regulatory factor [Phycisphaerae bacterium]|jgi:serine/threonine-protein kinase RsbT|nr:anti-sigma regulatory factor [Phycisphaerae bacterium]